MKTPLFHRIRMIFAGLLALAAACAPTASLAGDDLLSGLWHVTGKVETVAFHVTCLLVRHGDQIGGACREDKTGKVHRLTSGSVDGDQITWTHTKRFLFMTLKVVYRATLQGGQMQGELSAAGHSGPFTAGKVAAADAASLAAAPDDDSDSANDSGKPAA